MFGASAIISSFNEIGRTNFLLSYCMGTIFNEMLETSGIFFIIALFLLTFFI
jgi:hypothetical protein